MTAEENKKLILTHYESFVHQQDAEAVRKQLAAARLVEIKKKYDPNNVLRPNQNIRPNSPSNS